MKPSLADVPDRVEALEKQLKEHKARLDALEELTRIVDLTDLAAKLNALQKPTMKGGTRPIRSS